MARLHKHSGLLAGLGGTPPLSTLEVLAKVLMWAAELVLRHTTRSVVWM